MQSLLRKLSSKKLNFTTDTIDDEEKQIIVEEEKKTNDEKNGTGESVYTKISREVDIFSFILLPTNEDLETDSQEYCLIKKKTVRIIGICLSLC